MAYIFSLLLFFIAVSPVVALCDKEQEISCCADECSSETNEAETTPEPEDCGFCNPFFNCACYSGVILQEGAHLQAIDHFFYQQRKAGHKELTPFQVHSAFWQPPKIVA